MDCELCSNLAIACYHLFLLVLCSRAKSNCIFINYNFFFFSSSLCQHDSRFYFVGVLFILKELLNNVFNLGILKSLKFNNMRNCN